MNAIERFEEDIENKQRELTKLKELKLYDKLLEDHNIIRDQPYFQVILDGFNGEDTPVEDWHVDLKNDIRVSIIALVKKHLLLQEKFVRDLMEESK